MKATLNFDLSDSEQRKEHLRCILSTKMANILCQIDRNGYRKVEIEDNDEFNDGVFATISHIRELMEENGIIINDLID